MAGYASAETLPDVLTAEVAVPAATSTNRPVLCDPTNVEAAALMPSNTWADLAATWDRKPEADASPVENLTLPIEHYENGRVRAVLHAGRAAVGREGLTWAWQVAVDLFDPEGGKTGRVEADSCLYDRNRRRGYCPGRVRLVRPDATITGDGLYWSMSDQRMRIFANPVVQLARGARTINFAGGIGK